jgi:hypothetical protein
MTYKTLPTPSASNPQIHEYTSAVQKGYNSVFVMATDSGWNVTFPNTKTLVGTYVDMASAVAEAYKQSLARNSPVFVFDKSGEIIPTV